MLTGRLNVHESQPAGPPPQIRWDIQRSLDQHRWHAMLNLEQCTNQGLSNTHRIPRGSCPRKGSRPHCHLHHWRWQTYRCKRSTPGGPGSSEGLQMNLLRRPTDSEETVEIETKGSTRQCWRSRWVGTKLKEDSSEKTQVLLQSDEPPVSTATRWRKFNTKEH